MTDLATTSREIAPRLPLAGRLRQAARSTALSIAGRLLPERPGPFLRCMYCHWVYDDNVDRFEAIVRSLQRRGAFVDTARCVAMVEGREPVSGPTFHLSFDDGLRNNLTHAAPVLERLGVPATFFVSSAYLGAEGRERSRYCRERLEHRASSALLDADDCRELVDRGFEIGSHARTHRRLAALSDEEVRDEVIRSREELEAAVGRPCRWFAWPYGGREDADERTLEAVDRAGYEAAFGAFRGTVEPGVTDRRAIPRHHFEPDWPLSHVRVFANGYLEGR